MRERQLRGSIILLGGMHLGGVYTQVCTYRNRLGSRRSDALSMMQSRRRE
jgi:hypothetical protein